ncbi:MAG: hypothetical protein HY040_23820 [Planctomycetes bacterium]|nr:hypothetical protein [Planctomycetota bacterium]
MTLATSSVPAGNLGFLTVLHEPTGYVGGYLVTNAWGRPLEFRLSSTVQPNRVQQILYGDSLEPYLCGELIGKTLVEKASTPVIAIFTDHPAALELRRRFELPIALVPADGVPDKLVCHAQYPQDQPSARAILDRLGAFELTEPFVRVREAIAEARKLGIAGRGMSQAA